MKVSIQQKLNKSTVLSMMQCYKNSPCYADYSLAYDEIIAEDFSSLTITGYYVKKEPDKRMDTDTVYQYLIYCIVTLGVEFDNLVNKYFLHNDFVKGMIVNTIGDFLLFESSRKLYNRIKGESKAEGLHMTSRFEPGMGDIPVEFQKQILDEIHSEYKTAITLSTGYMYAPQKTLGFYYGASPDLPNNIIDHDCRKCQSQDCHYRKVLVDIKQGDLLTTIQVNKGTNLLDALRSHDLSVPAFCNGKKACGKCKVKQVGGEQLVLSLEEKALLTEQEIRQGVILACFHNLIKDIQVEIAEEKETSNIVGDYHVNKPKKSKYQVVSIEGLVEDPEIQPSVTQLINQKLDKAYVFNLQTIRELSQVNHLKEKLFLLIKDDLEVIKISSSSIKAYGVAVDIGTTTLVLSLIDLMDYREVDSYKISNPQGAYGADVISRINFEIEDNTHVQGRLIRKAILEGIDSLVKENNIHDQDIVDVVISGNTTMQYLLLDMNPHKLAISPFTTMDLSLHQYQWSQIFKNTQKECPVTLLPSISAYIGSDITSGFYYSNLMNQKGNILFIDIGTNGEMALKVDDCILCASTAAGPALEGANIKCGMSSVEGAINHIRLQNNEFEYDVIGHCSPTGICGSALIDLIGELASHDLIEPSGKMVKEQVEIYSDEVNHVALYQEDVRQFQLAKSAIAAGVEVLLKHAGLDYTAIDHVYLAGGFGNNLDIHQAVQSGLINSLLENKVKLIGNSSLGGCAKFILEYKSKESFREIQQMCKYIELSMDVHFNKAYIDHMFFQ
ncbi:ASKHA domain-containing protein [Vallitalea okinawensis]|uniref:ASKHA domain-containing protein n=1 Tax=Vallitalea okinawensis TaxID=2078660 RepID=UPI000CFBD25B|nr:ASKHA domain-containing protein [Vallitalea okinawensis]